MKPRIDGPYDEVFCLAGDKPYERFLYRKTRYGKRLRVFRVPQYLVENTIFLSGDGLEGRLIKKDLVYKAQRWLNNSERRVIQLYYLDGLTMRQTGEVLGLTESRISQIHKKAISHLRERFLDGDKPDAR